jgi:predicted amidohydrolase YtcJ
MSAEAIEKMRTLGVVANLQPAWLYLDGATLRQHFGAERLTYFHPYRTLADKGVIVGGGTDHMQKIGSLRSINPYNPFLGMWTTLVRMPRGSSEPLHSNQNLTREQAIRLYTINNAFITFEETRKGSLEPGKLADFIVLDRDILTCPVGDVKDIQVEATYLAGARVYTRNRAP